MPKPRNPVTNKLAGVNVPRQGPRAPVWAGPCGSGPQGGITVGLLSRWLACRERFRVLTMEGLKPNEGFSARLEMGNLWHACEEGHAKHGGQWLPLLDKYAKQAALQYPMSRDELVHWYGLCKTLFPLYVQHWQQHPDNLARTPLLQEHVFDVAYPLPSGRTVRLRGKMDSVDLVNVVPCTCGADRTGPSAEAHAQDCPGNRPYTITGPPGIWLQENKTKSSIDTSKIGQQVSYDLQTMTYLAALERLDWSKHHDLLSSKAPINVWQSHAKIRGIRYNVVRRSAHKQGKKETRQDFLQRIAGLVQAKPDEWFARWHVNVIEGDISRYRKECLEPMLENVCDDYEWWLRCFQTRGDVYRGQARIDYFSDHSPRHFRTPYYYNPIAEGGTGDVDHYLNTGSETGLQRVTNLFPELQESV